jgi:hypothetical protein
MKHLIATAKYWENIIVLLLSESYLKLEKQENPGWKLSYLKRRNVEFTYCLHSMEVIVLS